MQFNFITCKPFLMASIYNRFSAENLVLAKCLFSHSTNTIDENLDFDCNYVNYVLFISHIGNIILKKLIIITKKFLGPKIWAMVPQKY